MKVLHDLILQYMHLGYVIKYQPSFNRLNEGSRKMQHPHVVGQSNCK
jgi:hypothetical protein